MAESSTRCGLSCLPDCSVSPSTTNILRPEKDDRGSEGGRRITVYDNTSYGLLASLPRSLPPSQMYGIDVMRNKCTRYVSINVVERIIARVCLSTRSLPPPVHTLPSIDV